MLFNSPEFLLFFLPLVLIGFYALGATGHPRFAIAWLVTASLFFYGWWNPEYLLLMAASILFNYGVGALLCGTWLRKRKLILIIGLAANIAALGYFKYANFFVETVEALGSSDFQLAPILLPLAISFFTFQQITYLVDAYRGETKEYNFLHYILFVTFFPQLVAGPIVHHKEMLPQFSRDSVYRVHWNSGIGAGAAIFLIGLAKKVVIADGMAPYATPVFAAADEGVAIGFFEGWSGALAYTFQLYFDFSGYSDMAIGLALMFNIHLPLNFYSPYKATNITEFWHRWHMTLSRFLRDYVYIPLGGNRRGRIRRHANLLATMLLGGLWHGAGWTFVAWGALHGLYLVVNHLWHGLRRAVGWDGESTWIGRWSGRALTFFVVVVAWVLFRAESFSAASNVLLGMFGQQGFVLPAQVASVIPALPSFIETVGTSPLLGGGTIMGVFGMLGMFVLCFALTAMPATQDMSLKARYIALIASLYFVIQGVFFSQEPSEFLYFQF